MGPDDILANIIFGILFTFIGFFLSPKRRNISNIPSFSKNPFLWFINYQSTDNNQARFLKSLFAVLSLIFIATGVIKLIRGSIHLYFM